MFVYVMNITLNEPVLSSTSKEYESWWSDKSLDLIHILVNF